MKILYNSINLLFVLSLSILLLVVAGMSQRVYADCSGYCQGQTGDKVSYPVGHQCEGRDFCTYVCTGSGFVKVHPSCVNGVETGSRATPSPVPGKMACGDKCTSNSDCRNPSGNGSPVACVNGTCQNTMCPAGQTIPGGNCSCGSNTRKCGQTCNGTVGLCGPGQGSCTYVNSPQHWYTGQPDCAWGSSTYCANTKNGYTKPVCITGDTPGGRYLVAPNGVTRGITVDQMKASCQVCGNGEVEIGEECDLGANNGKPGFDCTANTCKKVSCNKVCATSADCGAVQHTVKLVTLSKSTANDILIDYVLDGNSYADGSPLLVPAGGTWSVIASADAHGGSYLRTAVNGASVSYKTYSSSIVLRTQGGPTRAAIAVYVDNVLKTTISTLSTQTGWIDVPVLVSLANQYTCYGAGTAKTCRLSESPTDSTCTPPPPTATPVPTPVALVCSMPVSFTSSGNKAAWKIGDKITFTVGAVGSTSIPSGSTIRYEGQVNAYRGTKQTYAATLSPINASASQFAPITIEAVNATYFFRFRYCLKNSQNVESCSAWGAWNSPIGN